MSGGCFVGWFVDHTPFRFTPVNPCRNTKSGAGRTFRKCWHISWRVFPWRNENPCQQKSLVKGCSTEQPQEHHVVFVVIGGEHVPIPRIWVLCMLLLLLESSLLHFWYKYDICGNYDCCRYYVVSTTMRIILFKTYIYYHCHDYYRCCYDHHTVYGTSSHGRTSKIRIPRLDPLNDEEQTIHVWPGKWGWNEQYVSKERWGCMQVELMYNHAKTC